MKVFFWLVFSGLAGISLVGALAIHPVLWLPTIFFGVLAYEFTPPGPVQAIPVYVMNPSPARVLVVTTDGKPVDSAVAAQVMSGLAESAAISPAVPAAPSAPIGVVNDPAEKWAWLFLILTVLGIVGAVFLT